jgi:putative DNA primase/helicase
MQPRLDVVDLARNRWSAILVGLGVPMKFLLSKNGPCPICGGKDRYRWTDFNGEGRYYCSGCGPGDGFDLAKKVTGKSFPEIRDYIIKSAGMMEPKVKKDTAKEDFEAQAKVWGQSRKPSADGLVQRYLTGRLGVVPEGLKNIRENGDVMIARVTDANDSGVNIHRTYLVERKGGRVDHGEKKVMKGSIPKGAAIRLTFPKNGILGIAEGIETALSAWRLFGVPTWSVISSVGMINWVPPDDVHTVVVYGDNDEKYAGQAAAYAIANRLATQFSKKVEVRIPPGYGTDWNDVLQIRLNNGHLM